MELASDRDAMFGSVVLCGIYRGDFPFDRLIGREKVLEGQLGHCHIAAGFRRVHSEIAAGARKEGRWLRGWPHPGRRDEAAICLQGWLITGLSECTRCHRPSLPQCHPQCHPQQGHLPFPHEIHETCHWSTFCSMKKLTF